MIKEFISEDEIPELNGRSVVVHYHIPIHTHAFHKLQKIVGRIARLKLKSVIDEFKWY